MSDRPIRDLLAKVLILAIRFYQAAISPFLAPSCRFHPSCSEYARTAIERYGPFRGLWLGLKRLARCHPFHPGGFDPVR
ncbi:MAG TPA: membrane protein insertion efficiency factor YidD [Syntrophales bacterium]|nr:membrane protein insertion efficiency factor YidD [Syntrophales bacterium]